MKSLWQNVRSARFVVLFFLAVSLLFSSNAYGAPPDGKALFKTNCSSCHSASSKKLTGPGLKGVLGRIPSLDWAHDWVHNNNDLVAKGDPRALQLKKENSNAAMTTFPKLTNEEIDAILNYVDPGPDEPTKAVDAGGNGGGATGPAEDEGSPVFLSLIIIVLLIVLIAILRFTKINLRNVVNEKEGLPEEPGLPFLEASRNWINNNKRKVALMGVFLFCVFIVKGWYALKGIGVYAEEVHPDEWVGYHPSQPINFSHKIHAGDNGIQCQYCHAGVNKSKVAGVPSIMVCMNCHRVISETKNPGSKEEIAKIYFAVGWNPDSAKYCNPQHPVEWNKVHVLPDFVFFSHQQHVVVGQLACDNCHGDVKSMTTVEQQRPLTMGWCVNCHRETPVQMNGNGYYTALHEKMKEKYKDQPITVSMVGGIECARCHY
ncbi:MAG TPA: c-type cytochrome [Bacteroidia bacterium]|nr:c-type cytochrome [Bacteroidia bacterium]